MYGRAVSSTKKTDRCTTVDAFDDGTSTANIENEIYRHRDDFNRSLTLIENRIENGRRILSDFYNVQ